MCSLASLKGARMLRKVQSDICDAEVHPDVVALRGGDKRHWLRMHYNEIVRYHQEHGPDRTMRRFKISRRMTLDSLLDGRPSPTITDNERAVMLATQALEGCREMRHKINDLEARVDEVEPMAKVGYAIMEAMRKALPGISYAPLQKPDLLSLDGVEGKKKYEGEVPILCRVPPDAVESTDVMSSKD